MKAIVYNIRNRTELQFMKEFKEKITEEFDNISLVTLRVNQK